MCKYNDNRDNLDTGDIVLYSGSGPFSRLIQFGCMSKWSHVGMVVRSNELGVVLVYQSTTIDKVKDYLDGELKNGVQINQLSESIATYSGDVAVRRLQDYERTPEVLQALNSLRIEYRDRPYEADKMELIKAAYDGAFGKNIPDVSTLFCSELVAECLKVMGGHDCAIPSNEFTPEDFAKIKEFGGIKIGDIEYLKN